MKLKEWRISKKLTRLQLAKKLEVSVDAIRLWEIGERIPNQDKMFAINRVTAGRTRPNDFYKL